LRALYEEIEALLVGIPRPRLLDDRTVAHDEHTVGERQRFGNISRHVDQRLAGRCQRIATPIDLGPGRDIDPPRWIDQNEDVDLRDRMAEYKDLSRRLTYDWIDPQKKPEVARQYAVFDRERRLQHWNRAYMQMWQFPESFLRSGVTMDEMLDELAKSGHAHRLENDDLGRPATDPKAFEPSGRWLYRRGDNRLLSVRRLPIGDEGYMAICSDLTAQKQHEDELVKAWEQAVIANRSKSEFLANVSHELRTPLNAIIGFSEVVERELFGPLGNERYVSYVRDIRNSGEHLLSLINDILDLSKIEAGRFQLRMEEVDCNEIAHSVARLIRPRTVEHGLTMKIDLPERPVVLNADKRAVKQVLINLLSNAVKFTPESGTVTLASRPWHDGVEFIVSDTGIGIDEKDMHVALAPFGQIDSQFTRKYEGTGLGLPLTKKLAELHGGRLEIESELCVGTKVTVAFPAERLIEQSAAA